jgi:hypothetical protein
VWEKNSEYVCIYACCQSKSYYSTIQFSFSLTILLNCWLLHTHVQVMSQQETAEVCADIISFFLKDKEVLWMYS